VSEPLIFEKGAPGRRGGYLPENDVPGFSPERVVPKRFLREKPPGLPEVSEIELIRHFTRLSQQNYGIDTGFYPLGSCTMKYNPKINEEIARLPGFSLIHPLQPEETIQGALKLRYELERSLAEIAGMAGVALQPAAGAQGELAGMLIVRAYHRAKGAQRKKVIIPDSAHGTNPASAALAGYSVQVVRSNAQGTIDLEDLKKVVDPETAALMLTNPNTLGLFEREIEAISKIVHDVGALMYLDGANLNALLGLTRPGDMGFDIVHFNLHKTFSTPHGGGGPGAGPVGVREDLLPYLPGPRVVRDGERYLWEKGGGKSIGRLHGFYGNFGILVRAHTYIRAHGAEGLARISKNAILGANYLKKQLAGSYTVAYDRPCMHEFVLTAKRFREKGVHAWDIAKRLIDYGFYPPTVNFPMIVEEALMIETPESESREVLDAFADAMKAIRKEIDESPEIVKGAPHTRPVGRLDEVQAAKRLDVRYQKQ
jgi:glycine dehydrogenase subunit 2